MITVRGRAEGPVRGGEELVPDQVADHVGVRSAEQLGGDKSPTVAERPARNRPKSRHRVAGRGHMQEGLEGRAVKVLPASITLGSMRSIEP